jgi:hypothetical protein
VIKCNICGNMFTSKHKGVRFCSPKCCAKGRVQKPKHELKRPCEYCNEIFTPNRKDTKYCSLLCQRRNYSKLNRQKINADALIRKLKYKSHIKARECILTEVRASRIPRAYDCKCVKYGEQAKEYHHVDYDKPYDVVAMCVKCHKLEHSKVFKEIKEDE